ncbi:Uma3 [Pseudomonas sp. BAY1663]|nr:Uma3 [Pseudomonas sp. BAY1663]
MILTGAYAYKIKKPVDFGFLDFTTLAARKRFCEEELRLNQRMAPELYLQVLPISGSAEAPVIDGAGEPFEYVLKMREFPQTQLLAEVQARGELTDAHIDALAEQIARFHLNTPHVPADHA